MLFSADAWPGLADGSITVTFRRWKKRQAKVGSIHRPPGVALEVDAVGEVRVGDLTDADARAAGEPDLAALLRRLGDASPDDLVWRVDFHAVDAPHPRTMLAAADDLDDAGRAEITKRLDRLDAASKSGPWTRATLECIGRNPAVVSTILAEELGRDRPELKLDIRKLKNLGLTESLGTGYRLSPRGAAYIGGSPAP